MADLYSTQMDKILNSPDDFGYLSPEDTGARARLIKGDYVTVGTEAAADKIYLAKLAPGQLLTPIDLLGDALGTNVEFDLGLEATDGSGYLDKAKTVADDDDLFTQTANKDLSSSTAIIPCAETIADNAYYELEKECYLIATVRDGGALSVTAAKNLKVRGLYATNT